MSDRNTQPTAELVDKIARLVEDRGWNQEDFARSAGLNRLTVRRILQRRADARLRNKTVSRCAHALGMSVDELRTSPIERLLSRRPVIPDDGDARIRRLYEQAMQPQLRVWLDRNPERAGRLSPDEVDELLSLQGTGGPLTLGGVEHFVGRLERKRKLLEQIHAIAGTEYLELLEKLVDLMYEKIQPYANRNPNF
jgi:transcriptional regulator with XRE-family HTH domain